MTMRHDANLDRDLADILAAYLGDGPSAAPDHPIDAALGRIAAERQRRQPIVPWSTPMSPLARILIAAALVGAVLIGGFAIAGNRSTTDPVTPTPSPVAPSAAASATASAAVVTPAPTAVVTPAPSIAPATPAATPTATIDPLAMASVARLDRLLETIRNPGGQIAPLQLALMRRIDTVRTALLDHDPAGAASAMAPLADAADALAPTIDPALAEDLAAAIATLNAVLRGEPVPSANP